MESKGIHAGEKHLAGNDQENNREGISLFFNEQAFREGALRGCEGSITKGGGMAIMQAFNRLGMTWCSANSALCTQVVRNEWGFKGFEETDAVAGGNTFKLHFLSTLVAGTDVYCLDFTGSSSAAFINQITKNDDGDMLAHLRDAAHHYLYTIANSAVMNGYSTDSIVVAVTPWWQPTMYGLITLFAVLEAVWVTLLLRQKRKNTLIFEEVK
jgi:beta-glucosidase